jgi:hypothetical protein
MRRVLLVEAKTGMISAYLGLRVSSSTLETLYEWHSTNFGSWEDEVVRFTLGEE